MKNRSILLFLILFSNFKSQSQCAAILPFTQKAMVDIHDIYQFTFLNKKPKNKLDTLVLQALYPGMIVDSNYYDWNNDNEKTRSLYERIKMKQLIDEIGQLKTSGAFLILNLPYLIPFKMQDDLTPLTSLVSNISHYGSATTINKYFLNNIVSNKIAPKEFERLVILKSIPLRKSKFTQIKYCKRLEGEALELYNMKQENPQPYDSLIEQVINKYLNKYHHISKLLYFPDSIMIEILQLPFTHDAQWDHCVPKVSADNGISHDRLGVIIQIGKDEFDQNKYIQRVYTLEKNNQTGQSIVEKEFSVAFISRTRRQCEGQDE
ncbi:MAG TPA: hypothetical protein PLU17_01350 [Chitinophagaceae bacterium]|nr:hypothetical protein [Chitinophagaceae bacterium]